MGARAVSMGARAVIPVIFNGCIILRKFQWVFCVRTYPRQARVVRMALWLLGDFSSPLGVYASGSLTPKLAMLRLRLCVDQKASNSATKVAPALVANTTVAQCGRDCSV